jgi:tRNA(Ile)-lysidine synthetase-like protein
MDKLTELKYWWFNNKKVWFNSNELDDIFITEKYEVLFDLVIDFDREIMMSDINYGLGYIILYDQVSRHIKRCKNYSNDYVKNKLCQIINFVERFFIIHKNILYGYEFCFTLLPLRHTKQFHYQSYVMEMTWQKLNKLDKSNCSNDELVKIYRDYLKATYARASKDNIYQFKNSFNKFDFTNYIDIFINQFKDILDSTCVENLIESNKKKLVDVVPTCVEHQPSNKSNSIEYYLKQIKNSTKNYILSISGGVDSMVISHCLKYLGYNFVMIHINYFNRGEICEKEKEMLKIWAEFLDVELYVRDLYEINRENCMRWDLRNLYEDYTKNARFAAYVDLIDLKNWSCDDTGIILGHNHDDCIENILTNITNKTKYENLYGMEIRSLIKFKENTLNFLRPILQITKSQIYNYAHQFNIPYLFDSTPKWSQRGIIRDKVRPSLLEWNSSSIEGLDRLANIMIESTECVDMLVEIWIGRLIDFNQLDKSDKIICKKINNEPTKTIKLKINELKSNSFFWSRFLEKIGFIHINVKVLNQFIERIKTVKNNFNTTQPKQLVKIQMTKNQYICGWKTLDGHYILGFYNEN